MIFRDSKIESTWVYNVDVDSQPPKNQRENYTAAAQFPECDTLRQANPEVKLEEQGGGLHDSDPRTSKNRITTSTTKKGIISSRT